jgi:N-acetylglucosaminyldiphosphoundecaprenol N-acetyl-beta-D-mannosaminyltransferase
MGVGFDPTTEATFAERIVNALSRGEGGYAVTPNTDIVRQAVHDADLARVLHEADLSAPDGMPIVWASRLAGTPLPERVAGSSAIYSITAEAARSGQAVFLLGGRPGAAEGAAKRFVSDHPGLRVGHLCPPMGFESDPVAMAELDRALTAFGPAVYFCGFGCPKQERLIASLRERYPRYWFVACGGSIDFAGGKTSRAPGVVQRYGLEWLWRLVHEPRRLFRRYVLHDAPFAVRMMTRAWSSRGGI